MGATHPDELTQVRALVGDMPFLIPGVGAQGGDLEAAVRGGLDKNLGGILINASRSVIFASSGTNFAEVAEKEAERLHTEIRRIVEEVSAGN